MSPLIETEKRCLAVTKGRDVGYVISVDDATARIHQNKNFIDDTVNGSPILVPVSDLRTVGDEEFVGHTGSYDDLQDNFLGKAVKVECGGADMLNTFAGYLVGILRGKRLKNGKPLKYIDFEFSCRKDGAYSCKFSALENSTKVYSIETVNL